MYEGSMIYVWINDSTKPNKWESNYCEETVNWWIWIIIYRKILKVGVGIHPDNCSMKSMIDQLAVLFSRIEWLNWVIMFSMWFPCLPIIFSNPMKKALMIDRKLKSDKNEMHSIYESMMLFSSLYIIGCSSNISFFFFKKAYTTQHITINIFGQLNPQPLD